MAERRLLFLVLLGEFERRGNGGNCLEESKVSNCMFSLEMFSEVFGENGFLLLSESKDCNAEEVSSKERKRDWERIQNLSPSTRCHSKIKKIPSPPQ